MKRILRLAVLSLGVLFMVYGCGEDGSDTPMDPGNGGPPPDPIADFSLLDVNPNSTTKDAQVSPRDYLQKVSAWYFGQAT